MKKQTAMVVAMAFALNAVPAHAFFGFGGGGGIMGMIPGATEITQILNNLELGLQTVEEYAQTYELIETKYLNQLQQLQKELGPFSEAYSKAKGAYDKIKDVHGKLKTMQGSMQNMDGMLKDRFKDFARSQMPTFKDYMKREWKKIADGDANAKAKMQANREAIEGTSTSIKVYQDAISQLNSSEGVHGATQLNGAILSQIGMDMNKLIAITAQANFITGADAQLKAAEAEKRRKIGEAVKSDMDDGNKANDAFFREMIKPPKK